jgi:hypothetical protein
VTKVSNVEDVRGARASEWEQSFETLSLLDATETLGIAAAVATGWLRRATRLLEGETEPATA